MILVEESVADADRARLDAEGAEARALVQGARRAIAVCDGEEELQDARIAADIVDEMREQRSADAAPRVLGRDEHPEDVRLVPALRPRLARPAHDAGKGAVDERAVDGVAAVGREPLRALFNGLGRFLIVA